MRADSTSRQALERKPNSCCWLPSIRLPQCRKWALVLGLLLAACGDTKAAAPTTTRPLPSTLPTTLTATEQFFDPSGSNDWTEQNPIGGLYHVTVTGSDICPTSVIGPVGTSMVSLISTTCVLGGTTYMSALRARALAEGMVRQFAPVALPWLEGNIGNSRGRPLVHDAGPAQVSLTVGTVSEHTSLDLSIQARGFRTPNA